MKKTFFFFYFLSLSLFYINPEITSADDKYWVESWLETSSLKVPRSGMANGVYKNTIYAAGGGKEKIEEGALSSVEFTSVKADGSLNEWKLTKPLNAPRIFSSGIVHNKYFYVVGGEKGVKDDDLLNTIERGIIKPDGSIKKWITESSVMTTTRRAPALFILGNRLYVSGGYNGMFLSDVESAEIKKDGSLGKFRKESSESAFERYIHTSIVYKNRVFLFGGHSTKPGGALTAVEWSDVNSKDGHLNPWREGTQMATKRYLNGAAIYDNNVYLIGGRNMVLLTEVSKLTLPDTADEKIEQGRWETDTPLIPPREALGVVTVGDNIYAIGGNTLNGTLETVLSIKVVPGKRLGHWETNPEEEKRESKIPIEAYSHFALGSDLIRYSKMDYALTEIMEGLRLNPNSHEGYYLLGQLNTRHSKFEEAKMAFLKALELKENYAEARLGLGIMYFESGDIDNALIEVKKCLEVSDKIPEAFFLLGQIYTLQHDFEKRRDAFLNAIGLRENFVEAHLELGHTYYQLKDIPNAIKEYQKVLALKPDFDQARVDLAGSYLEIKRFKEAITEYSALLNKYPQDKTISDLLIYAKEQEEKEEKTK